MTEFVVTRVDSTSKLIEMEDIASRLAGAPFQFETVLAGECTMYVARMRTAQAKRDVALMPVYASPTMALAGPTMLGRSFTLMAEITAWAREELGVATLLVPSKQQQQGVVLTETVIKKKKQTNGAAGGGHARTRHLLQAQGEGQALERLQGLLDQPHGPECRQAQVGGRERFCC